MASDLLTPVKNMDAELIASFQHRERQCVVKLSRALLTALQNFHSLY